MSIEEFIITIMTAVLRWKAVLWTGADRRDANTKIDMRNKHRLVIPA